MVFHQIPMHISRNIAMVARADGNAVFHAFPACAHRQRRLEPHPEKLMIPPVAHSCAIGITEQNFVSADRLVQIFFICERLDFHVLPGQTGFRQILIDPLQDVILRFFHSFTAAGIVQLSVRAGVRTEQIELPPWRRRGCRHDCCHRVSFRLRDKKNARLRCPGPKPCIDSEKDFPAKPLPDRELIPL